MLLGQEGDSERRQAVVVQRIRLRSPFELLLDVELLDLDAVQTVSRAHHEADALTDLDLDLRRLERVASGDHLDDARVGGLSR